MDKNQVKIESRKSAKFELVLQVRDNVGKVTGRTKSFLTDDPAELDKWYQRNSGTKKVRRKKEEKLATQDESSK